MESKDNIYTKMQINLYNQWANLWSEEDRDWVVGSFDKHNDWKDYDILFERIDNKKEKIGLDFGCGPGRNIVKYKDDFKRIDGVDLSPINIQKAERYIGSRGLDSKLYVNNGIDLEGIHSNTYDFVMSTICLQHICVHNIRYSIMKDIYRVLKFGGIFTAQMGYGPETPLKTSVDYFANNYEADNTNGKCDTRVEDYNFLKMDLEKIGFCDFQFKITEAGPGDDHPNWIFFSVVKKMDYETVFFDVGAHYGQDSIHIAENDSQCLVFAFEPTKKLYEELIKKTQHLKNYIVVPKAVSNFNGKGHFYVTGIAEWGCSSLLKFSDKSKTDWPGRNDFVVTEEIEVDVIRLDTFIIENDIPKINFIHIDTQGCDLKVLEGLGKKLSVVYEGVMEAGNKEDILYFGQNSKTESVKFLQNNEFDVTNIKPNDSYFNEVNIFFKKKKKMKKIKQYIVTYNNEFQLNKCLNSLYNALSEEELSMVEVNVINNHSNFHIAPLFQNKVKVFHNTLRPDFSTGHLSRNWNQALLDGFVSILEPDCDILITCQDDVEFSENFINNLIEHHKSYDLIQVGKGDSFMSYTINAIKKIGLWDERFCTIGFQEMDYYIRAVKYNFEKTSINDYFHQKVINPIHNLNLIKNTSSGYERNENHHTNSQIYFHVCSNLLSKKWSPFWEIIFYKPELRFDLEPQINSFVYYPYFERYVETLKEQKYLLQNDRIC